MMKKIKEKINARLKISFDRWLKRRMPAASVQKLSSKNIFIFPTKFGFIYLLFILLLFLFGTNYQNNVIILLSYVMASLFITCMLHSFFNLSGLTFVLDGEHIGFAEQKMLVPIAVITSKERFDLSLEFFEALLSSKSQLTKSQPLRVHVDKAVKGELKFNIPFVPAKRGITNPGRIKISSEYSLGFFTTWTRLDFNIKLVNPPKPIVIRGYSPELSGDDDGVKQSKNTSNGTEDFSELKNYIAGEPLTHVAWKQMAKGQGWLTKKYHKEQGNQCWLTLKDIPANNIEMKLAHLCFLVLDYHKQGLEFGLKLSSTSVPPSTGPEHVKNCLVALAAYPQTNRLADDEQNALNKVSL